MDSLTCDPGTSFRSRRASSSGLGRTHISSGASMLSSQCGSVSSPPLLFRGGVLDSQLSIGPTIADTRPDLAYMVSELPMLYVLQRVNLGRGLGLTVVSPVFDWVGTEVTDVNAGFMGHLRPLPCRLHQLPPALHGAHAPRYDGVLHHSWLSPS